MFWRKEKSLAPNEMRTPDPQPSYYSDDAIPAPSLDLHFKIILHFQVACVPSVVWHI